MCIEMSAAPLEVRVEDELTLTLLVQGASNPEQIQRPDLSQIDEFAPVPHRRFGRRRRSGVSRRERSFHYRLRPKNEAVKEIPPLLFRYWQPRWQYFATTASDRSHPADSTTAACLGGEWGAVAGTRFPV